MARSSKDRPLYMISVAAELAGVHPQTLRIYERKRLICPQRSRGNTRLYSDADIERLRLIQHLTQKEGINLAGVMKVLELQAEIDRLRGEADALRAQLRALEAALRDAEHARRTRSAIVRVRGGAVVRRIERP